MKALSLFSGIGGMDEAAERAGIEVVAMCEIEPFCRSILRKKWPDMTIFEDVRRLRGGDVGAVDLVFGGYPCQPFSTAGLRRAEEDPRHLWPEFMRLVRELRPAWVVGENVDGHIKLGLDGVLYDLAGEGYTARAFSIPAGAVGAIHRRYRTIVVANANGYGQQGCDDGFPRAQEWYEAQHAAIFPPPPRRLSQRDDIPAPRILGSDDGFPDRAHRTVALGNAVVPQHLYPVFKVIGTIDALLREVTA